MLLFCKSVSQEPTTPIGCGIKYKPLCDYADFEQLVGVETWMFSLIVFIVLVDGYAPSGALPSVLKVLNTIIALIATLVLRNAMCCEGVHDNDDIMLCQRRHQSILPRPNSCPLIRIDAVHLRLSAQSLIVYSQSWRRKSSTNSKLESARAFAHPHLNLHPHHKLA